MRSMSWMNSSMHDLIFTSINHSQNSMRSGKISAFLLCSDSEFTYILHTRGRSQLLASPPHNYVHTQPVQFAVTLKWISPDCFLSLSSFLFNQFELNLMLLVKLGIKCNVCVCDGIIVSSVLQGANELQGAQAPQKFVIYRCWMRDVAAESGFPS